MNNTYWNGLGLPPVGVTCEVQASHIQGGYWTEVEILAHAKHDEDDALLVCQLEDGDRGNMDGVIYSPERFRPIRTQTQIEAEERDAAINEMIRHVKDHPGGKYGASHVQQLKIQEDACRDLYLAGYRKQGEAK